MSETASKSAAKPLVSTDLLRVRHVTRYRYKRPVKFGPHHAMFRPHESNDLRLLDFDFKTYPASSLTWVHDVFSNSTLVFHFSEASEVLEIECAFSVVRSTVYEPVFPIEKFARRYPFDYPQDQVIDLKATMTPEYDDPDGCVYWWAEKFPIHANGDTWAILTALNSAIRDNFSYVRREEPGVQSPAETIGMGQGSCRDFAVLFIEAARRLGFAARFVTGYLYDPRIDAKGAFAAPDDETLSGAGSTHAWAQIFLPGAGWIEFDPTNGLIAHGNLIRTGVARTPSQAAPLTGSFEGDPNDFLGMDVEVAVTSLAPTLKD